MANNPYTSGYSGSEIDGVVALFNGKGLANVTGFVKRKADGTFEVGTPSEGSVTSVAVSNATNGGLTVSGSPITSSGTILIGHSNELTSAQTTQGLYPIKIDKNGHISEYGSEITSMPPSSHTHGNITDGGDITATAPTIASGDQIVINDHSASKITNGPTFDGSTTTQALTKAGTWNTFLTSHQDISGKSDATHWLNGSATDSVRTSGSAAEDSNYTIGQYAVAEGWGTEASGVASHAEGKYAEASENYSHAEGEETIASGSSSHAEGYSTSTGGYGSHAEGMGTSASGEASHAEGGDTYAWGDYSHAGGFSTEAAGAYQTVIGKFNIPEIIEPGEGRENGQGEYAFIIGNGTGSSARSNALTVDWSGNVNIPTGAKYKINGTALSASDVGAASSDHTHDISIANGGGGTRAVTVALEANTNYLLTAGGNSVAFKTPAHQSLSGYVPTSRTINSRALSSDITLTASDVGAIATTAKGANSGVAELDENGKVPSSQLPSYVDDVLEYADQSSFPTTGETGKIYIAQDTNKTYRWSGTAYVEISASLALGETSSTAYYGDKGKTAYDHSQVTSGNPHSVTASDVGLGNVGNFKAVSTVASQGLTSTEKTNAKTNIGLGSVGNFKAVSTLASQGLTDTEKTNARNNIGASKATNWVNGSAASSVRTTGTEAESTNYTMGKYAVAEGRNTKAYGDNSHAEGYCTNAQCKSQTTIGEYNVLDTTGTTTTRGDYVFIIGNGTGTGDSVRSNALTVDWSGNVNIASGAQYKINGVALSASDVGAATSEHTHALTIASDSGTSSLDMAANTKYKITAGGSTFIFKTPQDSAPVTSVAGMTGDVTLSNSDVGLGNVGNFKAVSTVASQGLTSTEQSNARANIGAGTSSLTIGTTSTTAAAGDHTHDISLATDTGTSTVTLASAGKYKLTAGGSSVIFTMPTIPTVDYPVTSVAGKTGAVTLSASDVGASDATNWLNGSATGSLRASGSAAEDSSYQMQSHAVAEGSSTKASGTASHAEGSSTTASGTASHAEGGSTTASGNSAHAEGSGTTASGWCSHAAGQGTIAQRLSQTVIGDFNIADTTGTTSTRGSYAFIIGNGTSSARSNALTVDWNGNVNIPSGASYKVNGIALPTTDTKNTAGSTNSTSTLYLIGATSQAANPQTYSSDLLTMNGSTSTLGVNGNVKVGNWKWDTTTTSGHFTLTYV